MTQPGIRLRFAPSPTGHLHIGGARTALFNWLLARKLGGAFVLRLEDTDTQRSTRAFEEEILRDLAWLGLDWDEGPDAPGPFGPYRQSERMEFYRQAVDELLASGRAYRCTCSPERLEAVRQAASSEGRKPKYDGLCRDLGLGPDAGPHVVRFRMPEEGEVVLDDLVKGRVVIQNKELDDFVLFRSQGGPTYNFVVVVDDRLMEITHVLRGDDHLNNTPKQIHIYQAMGVTPPAFGHMPLILGPDGQRLSKRHGATSVGGYMEMGFLPEALLNYLARLGWSHGDMELFSMDELLEVFRVEDIGRSAGRWDADKLSWVNQHWLGRLPVEQIAERARPFLARLGLDAPEDSLAQAVATVRGRSRTLEQVAGMARFYFIPDDALEYDEAAVAKFLKADAKARLEALLGLLQEVEPWTEEAIEAAVAAWAAREGVGLGKVAQPMRVAVTGAKVGPGIFETLAVLGKESALNRIRRAVTLGS